MCCWFRSCKSTKPNCSEGLKPFKVRCGVLKEACKIPLVVRSVLSLPVHITYLLGTTKVVVVVLRRLIPCRSLYPHHPRLSAFGEREEVLSINSFTAAAHLTTHTSSQPTPSCRRHRSRISSPPCDFYHRRDHHHALFSTS